MKHIHTNIVSTYLNNRQHNKVTNTIPLTVHHSETTLPRATRRTLAQLSTNKCPILHSYLNKIDEDKHLSPLCPLCKSEPHTTTHLFNCTNINTHLKVTDLWTAPVEVVHLLVEWRGHQSTSVPGCWLDGGGGNTIARCARRNGCWTLHRKMGLTTTTAELLTFWIPFYRDYHLFWLFCVLICYYVYHYVHSMYCILCVCICHYIILYLWHVLIDDEHQIQ